MLPFTRSLGLLRGVARQQLLLRANVTGKPARDPVTPAQQAVALTSMFVVFLVPSGWVLCHLEDYKHRPTE